MNLIKNSLFKRESKHHSSEKDAYRTQRKDSYADPDNYKIRSDVISPDDRNSRKNSYEVSGSTQSSRVIARRNSYQRERPSNNKIGTDIEEFLIKAGENSVKQFKKQQASEFISNKLQLVRAMNFNPSSVVLPITAKFPGSKTNLQLSPSYLFSQSSTISHVVQKQQVILPNFIPLSSSKTILKDEQDHIPTKDDSPLTDDDGNKALDDNSASVDEKLSFLRRSASQQTPPTSGEDEHDSDTKSDTDSNHSDDDDSDSQSVNKESESECEQKDKDESKANSEEKQTIEDGDNKNEDCEDEVTITRVVDPSPKRNNQPVKPSPVKAPSPKTTQTVRKVRKVFLKAEPQPAESEKNPSPELTSKTKVRVPSWFTGRCIELFKKRHKKIQQLKLAKMDPNATSRVAELKEVLKDIDREYIPLCKKTKSEYMLKRSGNNAVNNRNQLESIGLSKSDLDESEDV